MLDLASRITSYESGEMTEDEIVELFQDLYDRGIVFQLQGHYGRTAAALIEDGLLDTHGDLS